MPGLVGPQSFPIRNPEDSSQQNGRVLNPVRYCEMGGMDSAGAWLRGDKSKKNMMRVERATDVRAARQADKSSD